MAHEEHSAHHIVPVSTYAKVLAVLVVLTVFTVAVSPPVMHSFGIDVHWGVFSAILAFLIASAKAGFVLAVFMGLRYDSKLNLAIFLTGIFCLMILLVVCFTDIFSRIVVHSTL